MIIYDPDWNPSTDIQAREGMEIRPKRDITIYRLMTTGSIEENLSSSNLQDILTNKILKDPKQRRFFKANDLHDLFTLGDQDEEGTETAQLFEGGEQSQQKYSGTKPRQSRGLFKKKYKDDDDFSQVARISGVSKLDKFEDGDHNDGDGDSTYLANEDNRIMSSIFAQSGVHSTLQHDDIISGSKKGI